MQKTEQRVADAPRSWWDERLVEGLPLTRESLVWIGLIGLALVLRVWDLGAKMLHHDESLHATYSYYYYIGRGYIHDPMMHGPWQFTIMAFSYFLFGASEAAARLPHAVFGTILVGLPFLLRSYMSRLGALLAGIFICVSPSFLYFSRFAREDTFAVAWTMLLVVAAFRYYAERRTVWLYVLAAALSLAFSTKENAYITSGIVVSFFMLLSFSQGRFELLGVVRRGAVEMSEAGRLAIFVATLVLPLFTAFAVVPYHIIGIDAPGALDALLVAVLIGLALISGLVGSRFWGNTWFSAAGIFWGIFLVLHTSFLSNPAGAYTGAIGALRYWIEQQGVARGEQPWYYYLLLLPLYEFVVIAFGIAGIVYFLRKRNTFAQFLIWWVVLSQLIYGYTSEKMPWISVHLALPFALLAGMMVARIVEGTDWKLAARRSTGWLFAASCVLAFAAIIGLTGHEIPLGRPISTIDDQRALFEFVSIVVVFLVLVGLAVRFGRDLGRRLAGRLGALTALALMMVFSIHTAWQAVYYHADVPVEMLVYVQTTRDVGKVMQQIQTIAYRTGVGTEGLKVAYDSGVSWPFEWYLRDYTSRAFYGTGLPPADAPVVLASFDGEVEAKVRQFLGDRYVSQRYELRAWFDESDYRAIGDDPGLLVRAIVDPTLRQKLWRFLIYREPLKPAGSTDFVLFVRKDLASGPWVASQAGAPAASSDAYQSATVQVSALQTIGGPRGSANGQLADPRNVAVGPDGSVYVVDTGNNRIVRYDSSGQFVSSWGSLGSAEGQFREPWGIAVDPLGKVYVADSWNHRIQVFDANGNVVGVLGSDSTFYAPRGVALSPEGQVLVTDTGNHRIVVFNPDGTLVTQFGGRGSAQGQFQEPVGIAIAPDGTIYVADTWNHRIQSFDANFHPVAAWPVAGWASGSVTNKPYIAVDAQGNVYATDPEKSRVIEFSSTGDVLAVIGQPGSGSGGLVLPTGLAIDAQGNLLVADSGNSRIQVYAPLP